MVAVLLLHACGQPGFRSEASHRNQAGVARDLEGNRLLRHRSGSRRATNGRPRFYRYGHALQTLKEIPYSKWREYDPVDTIRFYSLRLREAGMIKVQPNKIITDGTDMRFLNELKRELKG